MIDYEASLKRALSYKQMYLGTAELSTVLGITKANTHNHMRRGALPEIAADLAMGPVWNTDEVVEWIMHKAKAQAMQASRPSPRTTRPNDERITKT